MKWNKLLNFYRTKNKISTEITGEGKSKWKGEPVHAYIQTVVQDVSYSDGGLFAINTIV